MPAPDPDLPSYQSFLRILRARDLMSVVDVNRIRDELSAAQIPGPTRGACFKAATHAGFLTTCGVTTADTPEARGRLVRQYLLIRHPMETAA